MFRPKSPPMKTQTKTQKKYRAKIKRKRKEADRLWIRVCLEEYGSLCEVCGKPAVDVHHFIPKSLSARLRLDIKNGVPLCRSCHFAHHFKADPSISASIINKRGSDWYEYLQAHRNDDTTTTLSFFEDAIKKLKEYLNDKI